MKTRIENYHKDFLKLINAVQFSVGRNKRLNFFDGVQRVCGLIQDRAASGGKTIIIGNGGSAAIASHAAIDFWKNASIPSLVFNDGSLLTCMSNDFGYDEVFAKPIDFFANKNDILFAISSSGRSRNILRAAKAAARKGVKVVTFTGFSSRNALRRQGVYNFYVPSGEYGFVEVAHQYICHLISDTLMKERRH